MGQHEIDNAAPPAAEEAERGLRLELANARERLAEKADEAFMHRCNYEAALAILSIFAPPDVTAILNDKLTEDWLRETLPARSGR